jgi:hypothetical protein
MTRRRSAARLFREWWPECLTAALLVLIGFAGQKDDPLFSMFCAVIGALFWVQGWRHRRLPLQATLEGVRQDVRDLGEVITTAVAVMDPSEEPEPKARGLRLVR